MRCVSVAFQRQYLQSRDQAQHRNDTSYNVLRSLEGHLSAWDFRGTVKQNLGPVMLRCLAHNRALTMLPDHCIVNIHHFKLLLRFLFCHMPGFTI